MKHSQNGNSMKASEFSKILNTFDENQINTVEDLRKLTKIYPYFHTANFLYVKTLQNKNNLKFASTLERTASISYDRNILMKWINGDYKIKTKKTEEAKSESNTFLDESKVNLKSKSLTKPKITKLSFTDWVSFDNDTINAKSQSINNDEWNIINTFLENDYKVNVPRNPDNDIKIDLSSKELFSDKELMTETLAKIFIKQQKYEKAIQAFKILSFKYPKKNALFADQIEQIKILLKKKNKK